MTHPLGRKEQLVLDVLAAIAAAAILCICLWGLPEW